MNKKLNIWKCSVVVLNIVAVMILGASLVGSLVLYQAGGRSMSVFMEDTTYLKSQGLKDELTQECYNISSYAGYREDFETEGTFDENKLINIMEYVDENHGRSVAYEPLNYRLGDLLKWSADETYQQEAENIEIGNEESYTEDVLDADGAVIGYKTTTLYNGNSGNRSEQITELYVPVEYENIEAYAMKQEVSVNQCYDALRQAISVTANDINYYYENEDKYNPTNTNLRYIVKNKKTGASYTNGSLENLPKNSATVKMTIHDYDVQIALDGSFPVEDTYAKHSKVYDKYSKYSGLMKIGIVFGLFGVIFSLCGIAMTAGRKEDKERCLYGIDRIPTELAIVMWGGIGASLIFIITEFTGAYLGRFFLYVILVEGMLFLLLNIVFLCAYASLIRRIKAGTLWKNSICGCVFHSIKTIIGHFSIVWKIVLIFGAFLLGNLIILLLSITWGNMYFGPVEVLLAFIYNVVVASRLCKWGIETQRLVEGVNRIADGDTEAKLDEESFHYSNKVLAASINNMGNGLEKAVEMSTKNERTKSELITNVSHDIKTPLTSIINYVGLLKMEDIQDEKVKGYIDVLDKKSQRLKQLTEDLVDASKISSGNIELNIVRLDFHELLQQTVGEFEEKFMEKDLTLVINQPSEPVIINADGKHMWRIIENLFGNVYKYAMPGTRVYVDLKQIGEEMTFSVRNISESPLNISAEELTERFIQGDISRSTEGSGLGLSIAKNLTTLQNGTFDIYLDGDLFKVTIKF